MSGKNNGMSVFDPGANAFDQGVDPFNLAMRAVHLEDRRGYFSVPCGHLGDCQCSATNASN